MCLWTAPQDSSMIIDEKISLLKILNVDFVVPHTALAFVMLENFAPFNSGW
jgi:hypothetical protein